MTHFNIDFRFDFQGGPTYYDGWRHERATVYDTGAYLVSLGTPTLSLLRILICYTGNPCFVQNTRRL